MYNVSMYTAHTELGDAMKDTHSANISLISTIIQHIGFNRFLQTHKMP